MRRVRTAIVVLLLALAPMILAQRTKLKPGFNLFSAEQDVEIGREVSRDADRQLKIINNSQVAAYVNNLGRKLVSRAPGQRYPYQFKVVNDRAINAFALPGGFLYVNRGIFENADNEAQLAGVISHEIGHVVLRHGTNQMSFEKLEAQGSGRSAQFFSSHPNPGNRIGAVNGEIARLGGSRSFRNDSTDFQRIKRILKSQ